MAIKTCGSHPHMHSVTFVCSSYAILLCYLWKGTLGVRAVAWLEEIMGQIQQSSSKTPLTDVHVHAHVHVCGILEHVYVCTVHHNYNCGHKTALLCTNAA